MIPQFYLATGRPLVWFGECAEHALVSRINDFVDWRSIVLAVVLLTVIYVGSLLGSLIGGLEVGIVALSLFVLAPGYAFMYFQSLPAVMVLFSLVLAVVSFSQFKRWLESNNRKFLIESAIVFVLACMIYPSFAFVVIPMSLLGFGFDDHNSLGKRLYNLRSALVFYTCASVIYYLLIRIFIMCSRLDEWAVNASGYQFSVQLQPEILLERIRELIVCFYQMPLLNFQTPAGSSILLLFIFSIYLGLRNIKDDQPRWGRLILGSIGGFGLSAGVLLFSMSPWLFSQMDKIDSRYLIPWSLFFCGATVGLISAVFKNLPNGLKTYLPFTLIVVLLVPVAVTQNNHSSLEVAVSEAEIGFLRSKLGEWIDLKGYENNKYILIVRPQQDRPAFVDKLYKGGNRGLGDNAVLSSAKNPVSLPWMIAAVLRERSDHPLGVTQGLKICYFNRNCEEYYLSQGDIVLGITNGQEPVISHHTPYVINFSELTSRPVYPVIQKLPN